ncbi:YihY/virulence factor BrkB family protein [Isoptericola variabilis]|uniref:Ribonuclease BN n=1 Tax=Isoptericola variabilis (strain 225) TaxID=743718 RepID=F6FRR8_ISOV2|nr:YihY/virulence factor BrkB family protein [Isoptericola variabilis]AEG43009.1 ribonuclease BN [Isoptericola variabilis 225]TWH30116.1 membrane protein [Isoptericola variabilis J7]
MTDTDTSSSRASSPHPDDDRKPDSPTELRKSSWRYALRTTVREFSRDECLDLAAVLTFYAVLAIAPALLAIVSVLGLFGNAQSMVQQVLDQVGGMLPEGSLDQITTLVENAGQNQGAGLVAFVGGLALALWSASGYVGAFGRAMNRVYEIDEGRPFWKLRPVTLLVTLVLVVVAVVIVVSLVLSGPVAQAVGDLVGLGSAAVTAWSIAKWPLVLVLVILLVAILYHATPNVRQPKFRWLSVGAVVAILVWIVASLGFGIYVARFASYDATYGSLAGVVIFLLWLWITNLALLFGAELDSELERGRELQGGIAAEETLQLPPRDTRRSDKQAAKYRDDVARGRELRTRAAAAGRRDDRADVGHRDRDDDGHPEARRERGRGV